MSEVEGSHALSAFFTSPDRSVQFHVFSPQWGGEPSDIPIDREREVCISWNCEEAVSQQAQGIEKRTHAVLKAKDSSYSRAYVDIREGDRVRYAFGIKYKNQAVYSRYLPLYLKFKSSLEQYTD